MVLTIKNFESQNVGPGVVETAPTNLVGVAGEYKATLTWTSATGESGVTWTEEKLVRKEGSAPSGSMDGTTVATITTKDTYATNGYEDTGLDSTKTYYYKVFAIYDNGTERGSTDVNVTPDSWTPGANTMCYYSFDNTLADGSGTYNDATNTGTTFTTVGNRKVLSITPNTYVTLPISDRWNLFTILFWINTTDSNSWIGGPSYSAQTYPGTIGLIDINYISIQYGGNGSTRRFAYNTTTLNDGNWHLVSFTSNNNQDWIVGVDDNFNTSYRNYNTTNYYFGGNGITLGRRSPDEASSITAKIGDFIIENKARTAQEISDYYNLTKGIYGL